MITTSCARRAERFLACPRRSRRRRLAGLALLLLAVVALPGSAQEPGFGLQPGLVAPQSDPEALTRRILSTTRYRLTPGDTYELVVILDTTERYPLQLTESHLLDIPYIGTMNVRGMNFSDLKQEVIRRIKTRVPVQYVDFLLSAPALFDVFVYGGVKNPGIATVNPLSRVSDALLLADGLMAGASVRRVELLRDGELAVLDLTRYTAEADQSQNPTLEPEDRIFVPQARAIVQIDGRIPYPGAYELLPEDSLESLLLTAGGISDRSAVQSIRIQRVQPGGKPASILVPLEGLQGVQLRHLDQITVLSALDNPLLVTIDGAVYGTPISPGQPAELPETPLTVSVPYVESLTLLDVLDQMGGPTPVADLDEAYLRRSNGERKELAIKLLWETRNPSYDEPLQPADVIFIPSKVLKVFVAGQVNGAGSFDYHAGLQVSDYIRAAGGISPLTGDVRKIFFVDEAGERARVSLQTDVAEPGTLIFVGKNSWTLTQEQLANILVITSFVTALISLTSTIISFIGRF